MAKRRYRKKPFKMRLKKDTIYTLSAIFMFVFAILLASSYSKNGTLLIKVNENLIPEINLLIKTTEWNAKMVKSMKNAVPDK